MSKELLSDELWRIFEPLLPTELSKDRYRCPFSGVSYPSMGGSYTMEI